MHDPRITQGVEAINTWVERLASLSALADALNQLGSIESTIEAAKESLASIQSEHKAVQDELSKLMIELKGVQQSIEVDQEAASRKASEAVEAARYEAEKILASARTDAEEIRTIAKRDAGAAIQEHEELKASLSAELVDTIADIDHAKSELELLTAAHDKMKASIEELREAAKHIAG